jgi:SET domain-containing protein
LTRPLTPENLDVVIKHKCAPIYFEKHEKFGYSARAQRLIRKNSFICEYVGVIKPLEKANNECDSIFDLFDMGFHVNKLVIDPSEKSNEGKYIQGSKSSQKGNIGSLRVSINNENRILLYAKKDIKQNQHLNYFYGKTYSTKSKDFVDLNDLEESISEDKSENEDENDDNEDEDAID